ncbi:MAG: hypothetical protein IKW33_04140 [Clostridia bacterium]|nr:hypothetical protein [Clostridia bacterium]
MSKINVKKIILWVILGLSVLMTLLTLCFRMLGIVVSGVDTNYGVNGFDVLGFKLPEVVSYLISSYFLKGYITTIEIVFGIFAYIILAYFIIYLIFYVLHIIKPTSKKDKSIKSLFITNVILTAVFAIVVIVIDLLAPNFYSSYVPSGGIKFKTVVYVPLIIQAVLLTAYILCNKLIKTENSCAAKPSEEVQIVKKEKTYNLEELKESLNSVLELLTTYKGLLQEGIISSMDYMDKKAKLLKYYKNIVETTFSCITKKSIAKDVIEAERISIDIIKQFKKLLEEEYIGDAEFLDMRVAMMNAVI